MMTDLGRIGCVLLAILWMAGCSDDDDDSGDDDSTWHLETIALGSEYMISDFDVRFNFQSSGGVEENEVDDLTIIGQP